jgi:hypothetical protein
VLSSKVTVEEHFVEDATCATTVRRLFDLLLSSPDDRDPSGLVALNYTGGTKVMAAHARLAFQGCGGKPQHACYLDEGGGGFEPRLRFDDGNWISLSDLEIPLTLETVLGLHGITHKPRQAKTPAPTAADAREILCRVLVDPPLTKAIYDESRRLQELGNPNNAVSEPFQAHRYDLQISLPEFPTVEQLSHFKNRSEKESWLKQWCSFVGGGWLEEWLGAQIRALNLIPAPEITVGVNGFRGEKKAQLEVDVAIVWRYRSYFVSCTTDMGKPTCKSKLFEVAVRSRQLGGDLARAALVCLADDRTVAALQEDVNDVWGASNTTKVFGLSDIRAWSGCDGKQPNLHSMKAWLES